MPDMNSLEPGKVIQFAQNIEFIGQQMKSRLVDYCVANVSYTDKGDRITDERFGLSDPVDMLDDTGPTPRGKVPQFRRVAYPRGYEDAKFVSNREEAEKLISAKNPTVMAMGYGLERRRDKTITERGLFAPSMNAIDQFGDPAVEVFPTANIIAVDNVRFYKGKSDGAAAPATPGAGAGLRTLTMAKIRAAKTQLSRGELVGQTPPVLLYSEEDLQNLMTSDEVRNADYVTQAQLAKLESGEIGHFMGVDWAKVDPTRLPNVPGQTTQFYTALYRREYLKYWNRPLVTTRITERADLKYTWQAYYNSQDFALRTDDSAFVWIAIER